VAAGLDMDDFHLWLEIPGGIDLGCTRG
jgi:hypothetical protein